MTGDEGLDHGFHYISWDSGYNDLQMPKLLESRPAEVEYMGAGGVRDDTLGVNRTEEGEMRKKQRQVSEMIKFPF